MLLSLGIHSLSSYDMTCMIRVIYGDLAITVDVIAGSGCQEELILEPADVTALNLPSIGTRDLGYADGSTGRATMYDKVTVELTLSDGSTVHADVVPTVLERVSNYIGVVATKRLLGFPAFDKLNLILDFRSKKLVKRIL